MTALEIACAAMVSKRTVNRMAAKLFPNKAVNGHMTTFSKEEALLLVRELRIKGEAITGAPRQSVSLPSQGVPVSVTSGTRLKLPSGAQLHEIRLLAEKGFLTKDQVSEALGVSQAQPKKVVQGTFDIDAPAVSSDQLALELRSLYPTKDGKRVYPESAS